jgi:hypothetical protein
MKLRWWHRHKWSKWRTYGVKIVQMDGLIELTKVQLRQRRECTECGYTQDEHVSYSNNTDDLTD